MLCKSGLLKQDHICYNSCKKRKKAWNFPKAFTKPKSLSWALCSVVSEEWVPLNPSVFPFTEGISPGLCGLVFLHGSRKSSSAVLLVLYTCFGNVCLHFGLPIPVLVVVTRRAVYVPTLVPGFHTRIPTRVPFEMVVSKIGGVCPPALDWRPPACFSRH